MGRQWHIALLAAGLLLAAQGCREEQKPAVAPPTSPSSVKTPETKSGVPSVPATPQQPIEAPTSAPSKPTSVRPTTAPATQPDVISMKSPSGPTPPAGASKVAEFAGLSAPKPATWLWQPPPSNMYVAEYVVPGRDGNDQARISVFQFGGSIQQNIDRWKGQFRSADQQPVEPKISELEVNGMDITLVEFAGEYMGMGAPSFTADRLFISAIVQAPSGQTFIRFVGPTATVEANRTYFMEMIQGLKEAEPEK